MSDGKSPDTTPGLETGASPAQQSVPEATLPADTPRPSSIESLATQSTPDISVEEATTASSERSKVLKELIPQLADYGITLPLYPGMRDAEAASPIVILREPAGLPPDKSGKTPSRFRYIAVTERGARVVDRRFGGEDPTSLFDQVDISIIDPERTGYTSNFMNDYYEFRIASTSGRELVDGLYLGRDATEEEAMQALARSIQRAKSTLPQSLPTPPEEPTKTTTRFPLGARIVNRIVGSEVVAPITTVDREVADKYLIEWQNARRQIDRTRAGYAGDFAPEEPRLSFEEAIARDTTMSEAPNRFRADEERQRIDTATRMKEFLKEPFATIQPSTPASQAA